MGTSKYLPHCTYEDVKHWEGRWALIQGIPYAMSPQPSFQHQRVSQCIAYELERALEGCTQCRAVLPVGRKIAEDTIVQPDNMLVCREVTNQSYLEKPPVLVFEVLSASTEQKDRVLETVQYAKGGLQ